MFGILNDFINGAIWLAFVIAVGFTGWRANRYGYFRAVSETYHGSKAQWMGRVCLIVAAVAGLLFLRQLLRIALVGLVGPGLFFLLGAVLGGYLTLRYYVRAV